MTTAQAAPVAAVYQQVAPDSPVNLQPLREGALDAYQGMYAKFADAIGEVGGFSDPEQWRFDWELTFTRDEWLDQMPTHGTLTQLSSDKLADVLEGVGAAIDAMGGSVTMPYATVGGFPRRAPGPDGLPERHREWSMKRPTNLSADRSCGEAPLDLHGRRVVLPWPASPIGERASVTECSSGEHHPRLARKI